MKKLFLLTLCLLSLTLSAQDSTQVKSESTKSNSDSSVKKKLIQFTGIIVTNDSLMGVGNVNIRIAGTLSGTISNDQGFFSMVASPFDTILFSAIGYKTEKYVVPDLTAKKYTMIQTLTQDTLELPEAIVKPYISKELFQHYFVSLELPDDQGDLDNMDPETLKEVAMAMSMDGSENGKYVLRQDAGRYYYSGQIPPINILNPFAWAQFIKAWKDGKLKIER
ncbi:MAG: carboxypeptidase-like regulatory domain-containing protein [Bacteroidetes bacterium]|nr:MAG: carboxypeptidase-like regulatory domain-containing protein [Bacteroidota bacterium]